MPKRTNKRRHRPSQKNPSSWLPIDTRILPDIISFGHVHGISRVFLTIEIFLVTCVMLGSLFLACYKLFL
jgi:hypothetical protein